MHPEKSGLKPVLLLLYPFLLLGEKRKRVRNNQLSYKTDTFEIHQHCSCLVNLQKSRKMGDKGV